LFSTKLKIIFKFFSLAFAIEFVNNFNNPSASIIFLKTKYLIKPILPKTSKEMLPIISFSLSINNEPLLTTSLSKEIPSILLKNSS